MSYQVGQTVNELMTKIGQIEKAISTSDTGFPVRENLAAEAKLVVAVDTPLLNRLPVVPGGGKAAAWKEITGFGSAPTGDNVFYAEAGAPSARTTVYADRSETYRLLGLDGGVSGLAIAAGASFEDQLALEKRNTLLHFKRLEEQAIINGAGTGNAFSGLRTQITTGNGSTVFANTGTAASAVIADLASGFKSAWDKGAQVDWIVARSTEAKLLNDAATLNGASSALVVNVNSQTGLAGGFYVNRWINPIDGSQAEIIPDKFHTAGELLLIPAALPAPIPGQGGNAVYLDVLLDYSAADVPTSNDQMLFRIKRYACLPMPGRLFCAKISGY